MLIEKGDDTMQQEKTLKAILRGGEVCCLPTVTKTRTRVVQIAKNECLPSIMFVGLVRDGIAKVCHRKELQNSH